MSTTADLTTVIRHLGATTSDTQGDPELLDRYAHGRDEAAFAALVRRYGPLVLGVARRQVVDRDRAEDVFQATFLALARSVAKLGGRPVLANWLYTVALRQARKARVRAARSEARDRTAPVRPITGRDPLDEITGRELLQVIDDELANLPDRLRLPVLLCCVQGLSREEAAHRLGVSAAVVKGRLERGRHRLAARLAARGLAPSAMVLAPLAAVVVPDELLARTLAHAAAPWSKAVPLAVAELATTAAPRSFLPVAVLAGCVLVVSVMGWAFAAGGASPVQPVTPLANPVTPSATRAPTAATAIPEEPLPNGVVLRFGSPRYRHPTAIEGLAVSADGKFAVANSGGRINSALRIYDLATGRGVVTIKDDRGSGYPEAVAFSPDGKTLAIKQRFTVRLHDTTTGKETSRVQYAESNPSSTTDVLTFSPDGKQVVVATAEGNGLHLIDLAQSKVVHTLKHANVVFAAAFSPDGKHVVGGGYDSEKNVYFARLWHAESGNELRRFQFGNGGIRCISYSPDGATLAIGGDGGKALVVKLFDPATGKEQVTIPFPEARSVRSVAFAPDGKTLAASGGATTRLFDTATGKEARKIDGRAIGLRFSPDGKVLTGAVAGTIYRWDAATGKSLIPEGGDSPVGQIEVTADGKHLITRGQDGDAHIWDARTDEHLRRVNVTWQRGLAVSPDGRFLVWPVEDAKIQFKDADQPNAIHTGSRIQMMDLTTGQLVERFAGFEGDAHDLFFTAAGKTLVTVDHRDGGVRFWDVATGKMERSFRASVVRQQNGVWRSRLSPDGKVLAVTYQPEGRGLFGPFPMRLWDTTTGNLLHELPGHRYYVEAMVFSPDGKYLVTGSEALNDFAQKQLKAPVDQVFIWDVATGKSVASLPTGATAAAFTADGKTLALTEKDGTIQFWDTAKWTPTTQFAGPRERILTMTFGPSGQLFTGSADATAAAWNPRAAKAIEKQ